VAVDGRQAQHTLFGNPRSMLTDATGVATFPDSHRADAALARLFNGQSCRLSGDDLPNPPATPRNGHRWGVGHNLQPGARHNSPFGEQVQILSHANDAMGIHTHQVASHQRIGDELCILCRDAGGQEHVFADTFQVLCFESRHISCFKTPHYKDNITAPAGPVENWPDDPPTPAFSPDPTTCLRGRSRHRTEADTPPRLVAANRLP